jgi:deoxyribodipyrimidine photolyase-related protein
MKFWSRLARENPEPEGRRWVYVPYDQLTAEVGPLAALAPSEAGIILVESPWKARRRRYHKQKLALVLANQRHFALEQANRGVAVRYLVHDGPYAEALETLPPECFPLRVMEPAERELRRDLRALVEDGRLEVVEHAGWLTTPEDFRASCGGEPPWKMDSFYRHVRKRTGLLMQDGKPVGGRFSFDAENRKPWKGAPPEPALPRFAADEITREVFELVAERFSEHPGELDPGALPATEAQAKELWVWARRECMVHFGPYEDAMSREAESLFHTRISPLLNIHRLLPHQVLEDVLALDLPLPSQEGFLRQVLGWREFVRHVHRESDGFRSLPRIPVEAAGAAPPGLGGDAPLPPAFWGNESGLACLDTVVAQVWREGWSHHITRLMVLSNLATLLGVSPRELTDWFWVAYVDAYDWVVEPNVLGMGTFAVGPVMSTKPYVSGAAYLNKMSDYCGACAFHPKKDCPITAMYWDLLGQAQETLAGNHRMALPLASQRKRGPAQQAKDRAVAEKVRTTLAAGLPLRPEDLS